MVEIRRTEEFARWLRGLRDLRAKALIQARIERISCGNPGNVRPVGPGISELLINYGPGYKIYFQRHESALITLLAGGDYNTQTILNKPKTLLVTLRRVNDSDRSRTL